MSWRPIPPAFHGDFLGFQPALAGAPRLVRKPPDPKQRHLHFKAIPDPIPGSGGRPLPHRTPFGRAVWRGFLGRCPNCGRGAIFHRYLKVRPNCGICGHDLDAYPSDDGPAYFTVLLVGQFIVAPLLLFPFIVKASAWIIVPATLIPLAALTLVLLPRIKGAVIGALYALGVKRSDAHLHTADRYH
ncbi:MAG: DUF983 domain-containing protein [Caulobacteraceae bacterium]